MGSAASLIERLSNIVGSERVRTDRDNLEEVCWDALSVGRIHPLKRPETASPLCVVLPVSSAEVRQIILLANEEKLPIVPYGGGSGLMGGAITLRPGIVLDTRRMDRVLEVDKEACFVRAQAGLVLEVLERRLSQEGLMLGHDPWTLPVATVGGAISTNSLGYRGAKYGSMGDEVLGLEVVLPNGEILTTRAVPKSSTGIALNYLFIGGEGCFGVITEATLRVFPRPERRSLNAVRFSSFEAGFLAIQNIYGLGLKPALMDFGDDAAKVKSGAILYLAFEGAKEVVEAEARLALDLCEKEGGKKLAQEEAEEFWRDRHVIARRFKQNRLQRRVGRSDGIRWEWVHVALPASRVLDFRKAAMAILAARGIALQESGLWTRPELFSMRLAADEGGGERAQLVLEDTVEELLRLVQRMGGSMEYCHGVGVKLAPLMAEEHGYGLEVMRQIKTTLDPNNIMNPGKMAL
ncbi:MAG: FAD-binding oxidoreductase [Deltaproteobacteria bacterium]|nr:FAD-binding oxidoreductase [Deltaproteobacteria bacterium]